MHISYTSHDAKFSSSSSSVVSYLDKENSIDKLLENEHPVPAEHFFNSEYNVLSDGKDSITGDKVSELLDANRGSQKLDSSNFYMINVAPSHQELKHLENLAIQELNKRGIILGESKALDSTYHTALDQLMKFELKQYSTNLMEKYAQNFDRDIYINEDKLPSDKDKVEINKEVNLKFSEFLASKNIDKSFEFEKNSNSKSWKNVNNLKEISKNEKHIIVELDLKDKGKANVYIPKNVLHLQENGTYNIPADIYDKKEKEVIAKNTLVEIKGKSELKVIHLNAKKDNEIRNFKYKDNRFENLTPLSFNEKDLVKKDGKYFVNQHLLETKKEYVLNKNIENNYSNEKEKLYKEIAERKGFDLSTRKLTEKDLLWFGKIETQRTYKFDDKSVVHNEKIQREILNNKKLTEKDINKLKESLIKDFHTGKEIERNDLKGGLNYHAHIVVSRHDKTMQNSRNKISLSPLANHKEGSMNNGAKVGFDRSKFAQEAETLFDKKMEYNRSVREKLTTIKQNRFNKGLGKGGSMLKNQAKNVIGKQIGINVIKEHINPLTSIKKELGMAKVLTSVPKSLTDLAIKTVKSVVKQGLEY